jgi:UDP-N-acetylmuramoyl-L-alanyl-D-glutamate--2,6-diaminopimelate ligase/murE/murF fusion protein
MNRTLHEIAEQLTQVQWQNAADKNPSIMTLAHDSRTVRPGTLFVCIPGAKADGHDFAEAAVSQGAVAVLAEHPIPALNHVPVLIVPDVRTAVERIAPWFYDNPGRKLRLLAVTGTNGKTTATHIIRAIFNQARRPCGVIGTLHILIGDRGIPVKNTTPDVMDLQATLAEMVLGGMEYVAMEVSSHALALNRIAGCEFDVAVFTNITQDHLDFHGDLSNYREAKAKLFRLLDATDAVKLKKTAIVNFDDSAGNFMQQQTRAEVISYGIKNEASIRAVDIELRPESSNFLIRGDFDEFAVRSGLTGQFNVYNMLAAAGTAMAEGIAVADIQAALEKFSHVAGRFERVAIDKPFSVIVDYAHTPDGLENVLRTARQFVAGKLIAVFGCGGDRDRTKRPIMGGLAARYADRVIVTSDNPRSEDAGNSNFGSSGKNGNYN